MFPLYKKDGMAAVYLSKYQQESLDKLLNAIESGELNLVENKCLCNNEDTSKDVVISEKDRYGISVSSILCSKCGLIRTDKIFDEKSNNLFYKKFYRDLYVGQSLPSDKFFYDQVARGEKFLSLVEDSKILNNIDSVTEIGCGAGGIIYPFYKNNKKCKGFDYNENYLTLGRKFGLDLVLGDWVDAIQDNSVDLLIISHVMEHFISPIEEIKHIIKKIKPGKYLLVEVPGIFFINKVYLDPLMYLQNAHVYNYYQEYLNVFFTSLGLDVIYGDERCTFLLQKPENWIIKDVKVIYNESISVYFGKISQYLIETHNNYKKFKYFNVYYWKNIFSYILDKIGLKKIVKKILKY